MTAPSSYANAAWAIGGVAAYVVIAFAASAWWL